MTLLIITFLFFPALAAAEDGDAEFAYAAGYFKKERWKYASEAFAEFIQQHPKHSRAHMAQLYFGLSLNKMDQFEPAREQLRKFVKEYPTSQNIADARFHIGECSYNLRDYKAAVIEFSDYQQKHAGHNLRGWANLMLGESYNELSQWQKAAATLKTLLASSPEAAITPDAMFALGVSLQGLGRTAEAILEFEKVVATNSPTLTHRALARIGTTHYNNKDYAKASEVYDKIVSQFPNLDLSATAAFQSGISQFQLGNYEQALERLDKVPEETRAGIHAAMWTGFCYRELGQLETARKALSIAFAAAGETPLAAEILFNRAQVELIDKQKSTAAQMFLDLSDRWPEDRRVADSLFNAAQIKMELADLTGTQRIIERLRTDHPAKAKEAAVKVLMGRLLLNEDKAEEAIELLTEAVATPSANPDDKLFRKYHLVRALHRGRKYAETIALFETMRPALIESGASEFHGAASMAAMSCLETRQFAKAEQFANDFLTLEKDPAKRSDALAARAVAYSSLKQFEKSQLDLTSLVQNSAENPQTWMAVLQSAEAAWGQQEYEAAATFFELAANEKQAGVKASVHESATSGAAWSHYKLGQFPQAAALFRQVCEKHPESNNASEAAYMEAMSIFEAEDELEAAKRFLSLYENLDQRPEDDAGRTQYMLDSGRMYARILGQSGQIEDADAMWEQLATKYSESKELDAILDSWAFLNLQNGRYSRSDEIYRQLLDKFPSSRFSGQARLSLAESEMQANRLDTALKEFIAIVEGEKYGDEEKQAALYHVIDIYAAQRDWPLVMKYGEMFADRFSASERAPEMQLLYAEALLDQKQYDAAREKLSVLRDGVLSGLLSADDWTERVWVVFAEVALAEKRYSDIDLIEQELVQRNPKSRFLFQMQDVQGRRWKSQANPDFERSREYLGLVTRDEIGRRTETAARCQFLIGETFLLENNYAAALKEYYRVYLNYPFDDWRVKGLFQAAGCEFAIGDHQAAKRSYEDLIKDFPGTEWATQADDKLKELATGTE